jgi:hypothetical protein
MPILNSSRLVLNDKKATFWYRSRSDLQHHYSVL